MNDTITTPTATEPESRTATGEEIDTTLLRGFLKRALGDEALVDRVNDLLFDHVVGGRHHPSVVAEELSRQIGEVVFAARHEDWQAVADDLIAEARDLEGAPEISPLRFIDFHRQRYAAQVPVAGAGEFNIGSYREDGGLDEDGEFTVKLIELMHGRGPALTPHLEVFGDGDGALRRAIDAGLLDALGPVSSRDEFARRLLAMGMVDGSDRPLPGGDGAEA
ncbi:MAG: hypothetical protein QM729_06905 [Solirubrobacterales bacterium]